MNFGQVVPIGASNFQPATRSRGVNSEVFDTVAQLGPDQEIVMDIPEDAESTFAKQVSSIRNTLSRKNSDNNPAIGFPVRILTDATNRRVCVQRIEPKTQAK